MSNPTARLDKFCFIFVQPRRDIPTSTEYRTVRLLDVFRRQLGVLMRKICCDFPSPARGWQGASHQPF